MAEQTPDSIITTQRNGQTIVHVDGAGHAAHQEVRVRVLAAHAVGSAIHYKKQHMKEEANVSLPAFGDAPGSPDKETEE